MTEAGGHVEFIGVGKPEVVKKEHPVVGAVKKAVAGWWERVGPGSIEHAFVDAHRNILKHIDGEDRQQAFAQSAETWRRVGTWLGYGATAVDFGVGGLGLVLLKTGWQVPDYGLSATNALARFAGRRFGGDVERVYANFFRAPQSIMSQGSDVVTAFEDRRKRFAGRAAALVPGAFGIGVLAAGGPAHLASGVGAKVVELFGIVGVHGQNYVASGKASEHAKAVGGALGKGAEVAVKYAAEHPEEIRKTMETVEDMRIRRERERVLQETARRQAAERAFERRYQDWLEGMSPNLKAFYRDSHSTPSRAEFMKETGDKGPVVDEPKKQRQ